jgi:hypothetical protein
MVDHKKRERVLSIKAFRDGFGGLVPKEIQLPVLQM